MSGTNVVTTENSDWATNCPEYKVTAVQVMPAAEPGAGSRRSEARTRIRRRAASAECAIEDASRWIIHHLVTMANQIADFFQT